MPDILKTMPSCNGLPPSHSKPSISQNIRQELLYFKKATQKLEKVQLFYENCEMYYQRI